MLYVIFKSKTAVTLQDACLMKLPAFLVRNKNTMEPVSRFPKLVKILSRIRNFSLMTTLTLIWKGISSNSFISLLYHISLISCAAFLFMYICIRRDKARYRRSMKDATPRELETMSPIQVALYSMVMTRFSSRLVGFLMGIRVPKFLRRPFYTLVCKYVHINVDEFEGTFEDYPTPNEFFTRTLKENARPVIRHKDVVVSPCDCTVLYMDVNPIDAPNLKVHQVKGIRYQLEEFLGSQVTPQNSSSNLYTVTLYLSPSDYHRVHSPTYFSMKHRVHFPGKLLPVRNFFVQNVRGLFTINERVVLTGKWPQGFFSMGLVGACNVGSISLSNAQDADLRTNRLTIGHRFVGKNYCFHKDYLPSEQVQPGDAVGMFHLGSTVVLTFESKEFTWLVKPGEKLRMGQPLGFVKESEEVRKLCKSPSLECVIDENDWSEDEKCELEPFENIEMENSDLYELKKVDSRENINGYSIYRMNSVRN